MFVATLAILVIAACASGASPAVTPGPSLSGVSALSRPPIATASPSSTLMFSVGPDQARYVATVVAFVDAFNAGVVPAALALLTDDVVGNDCDYGRGVLVSFRGKSEAESWLRARAGDHDRMEIDEISNSNPDPATGSQVVAVEFRARKSDLLPQAIVPSGAAKVVFTSGGRQIRVFANAGTTCRP